MDFIHEDRDFDDLLRVVAQQHGLPTGLVKKDCWVTHALWAIHHQRFAVWCKGGTSLSKGFGLIERFSEDLDVENAASSEPGRSGSDHTEPCRRYDHPREPRSESCNGLRTDTRRWL